MRGADGADIGYRWNDRGVRGVASIVVSSGSPDLPARSPLRVVQIPSSRYSIATTSGSITIHPQLSR
jgi:hypothetical protein